MRSGWQELLLQSFLLLGALATAQEQPINSLLDDLNQISELDESVLLSRNNDSERNDDYLTGRGSRKFGDRCNLTTECGFNGSVCDTGLGTCQCIEELPITNHIDKCGKEAKINETCFFNEQCEVLTPKTECRDSVCVCRFELQAILNSYGTFDCQAVKNTVTQERYVDPAMIGILVAMFLMFITICVVLRLFSRARWRENRTIFNTPNPRLMNVSLLRDSKLLHQERKGSRSSVRGPSRQPSMASLRTHSPNSQGSRRGSRGSSNASATSTRSNKSPPGAPATHLNSSTPMLESVTVEIQDPRKA